MLVQVVQTCSSQTLWRATEEPNLAGVILARTIWETRIEVPAQTNQKLVQESNKYKETFQKVGGELQECRHRPPRSIVLANEVPAVELWIFVFWSPHRSPKVWVSRQASP